MRRQAVDRDGNPVTERVVTTPGRVMMGQLLPLHPQLPFSLINRQLTKKSISDVIDAVYRHCGQKESVIFADRLMGHRLPPGGEGRHLLRQGRHDDPGREDRG